MTPETICGLIAFTAVILTIVLTLVALHADYRATQRRPRGRAFAPPRW